MSSSSCGFGESETETVLYFERKWSFALLSTVTCDVHINMLSDFGFLDILRSGSRILHSGGN